MTNGEKYKKAFSVLQTSKGSLQEVENMAKLQKRTKMKKRKIMSKKIFLFSLYLIKNW